ncbi:hypothetical protein [Catenovulum agarivorans]|uniref:hypothetical protein n=1 Tax=Catenovulum agarivorans TaxID=1172192 RepID=UPI0002F48B96|nr:hypothetical protein [Catenovulum agarivorans]
MTDVGFINSGLQSQLHQQGQLVTQPSANNNNTAANSVGNRTSNTSVTISPQAQLIQKSGELSVARQQQAESTQNNEAANDSVRVTSSLGKAASSVGLTEQEAIKLYEAVKDLL